MGGSSPLSLKGTAPPFGSNDQAEGECWDVSPEVKRPPKVPSLRAAAQGRWTRDAASASPPPLPFWELVGLSGGGEGVSAGLGESGPPLHPFGPVAGAGAAPRYPWPEMGPTPACELLSGLRRLCLGQPREDPSWVCEQVLHGTGLLPDLEFWRPAKGAAMLSLTPGLTDVKEKASRSRLAAGR